MGKTKKKVHNSEIQDVNGLLDVLDKEYIFNDVFYETGFSDVFYEHGSLPTLMKSYVLLISLMEKGAMQERRRELFDRMIAYYYEDKTKGTAFEKKVFLDDLHRICSDFQIFLSELKDRVY